jgi:hypothetical protein
MRGLIPVTVAAVFLLLIVLPFAGLMLGYDPWLCFFCGVVLMFAGAFAGVALFAFPQKPPTDVK